METAVLALGLGVWIAIVVYEVIRSMAPFDPSERTG